MAELRFQKWQATGNDFVIIDNRNGILTDLSSEWISRICNRNFGVGADGFMFIQNHPELDFEMKYYNADGLEAEMCGNGARSIIGFVKNLRIIDNSTTFQAIDGVHQGWVLRPDYYRIKMVDVDEIIENEKGISLNTGVPHLVIFTEAPDQTDVFQLGKEIRYSKEFAPKGSNVNFSNYSDNILRMRTYERGVENETLSCGTGAVASAIATEYLNNYGKSTYEVQVPGGKLKVSFERTNKNHFQEIYLEGEAKMVFEGNIKPSVTSMPQPIARRQY
ncbi:MAG: diaminopimelate epimerase [Bacteroidota bacterium]|nr:diaminopimelate epimerase [Bacteroidota bacterium]